MSDFMSGRERQNFIVYRDDPDLQTPWLTRDPKFMDINTPEGMKADVEWQQGMVNTIKQGGVWMVPRSLTMLQIDHANKTATVTTSELPEPDIDRVFAEMGWKVIRPESN